jgi:hypothetical protein
MFVQGMVISVNEGRRPGISDDHDLNESARGGDGGCIGGHTLRQVEPVVVAPVNLVLPDGATLVIDPEDVGDARRLHMALLQAIAEQPRQRITVADLLHRCLPDAPAPETRHAELPLWPVDLGRAHASNTWERIQVALREMEEHEGWIALAPSDADDVSGKSTVDAGVMRDTRGLVITMTRRGQHFLQTGRNPPSRHGPLPARQPKNAAPQPRHASIADMVHRKAQSLRAPHGEAQARERIAAAIAGRRGQQVFRQRLLDIYGTCLVTGCDAEGVLEAAHIQPYRGAGTFLESNGLLLRADIHTLFDLGVHRDQHGRYDRHHRRGPPGDGVRRSARESAPVPPNTAHIPDRGALDVHRRHSAVDDPTTLL